MVKVKFAVARANFGELVRRVRDGKESFLLFRHGKPVAQVTPITDEELSKVRLRRGAG